MTTTKTLMLATIVALSLSAGNAMADGSGGTFPDYQSSLLKSRNAAQTPAARTTHPQAGSTDIDPEQPGTATYILKHHLFGAGGFSG
jgi:hypothetical protein